MASDLNAIQHGFAKNVWMKVESDLATGEAVLTIEDDGQGLPSNSASDGSIDSRGIGILICRRILSRYDGKLECVVKKTDGIRFVARWNPKRRRPATGTILSPFDLKFEP